MKSVRSIVETPIYRDRLCFDTCGEQHHFELRSHSFSYNTLLLPDRLAETRTCIITNATMYTEAQQAVFAAHIQQPYLSGTNMLLDSGC